jgi:hypothetical protein
MCDYITKLCSIQAGVILNHVYPNVHGIGQREGGMGSIRCLDLVVVRPRTIQLTDSNFGVVIQVKA